MRIKIDLVASKLPIAYSTLFMSAIKEAIKVSDPDYYQKLYFYGDKSNKVTKNFTFSVRLQNYKVGTQNFELEDKASLIISTPDLELGLMIYNGMNKMKKFTYKTYKWSIIRIDLLKEREISGTKVMYKTLSPICVKNKEGKYIDLEDEGYELELNYITHQMLKNYRGNGLKRNLSFVPVEMKKLIVKEAFRVFKEKTSREFECVNAYRGSFILEGDAQDLQLIYQMGLGFKRSQGFGNLDVMEWR